MLDEKQLSSFQENGYLIVDDAFDSGLLERLRSETQQIVRAFMHRAGVSERTEPLHDGVQALENVDHKWVAYLFDTLAGSPALRAFHDQRHMAQIAATLLGRSQDSPLYVDSSRVRVILPEDETRTYRWHQEVFYTLPQSPFVQVWAPLIEQSTVATGTIEVCPGSHVEGVAKSSWNEEPGRAVQITVDDAIVGKYTGIPLELQPGQAVLLHADLVHRSGSNTSGRVRYSLVGKYHDAADPAFCPPVPQLKYAGLTPKQYHDQWTQKWPAVTSVQ